jgi:hypothetical protein
MEINTNIKFINKNKKNICYNKVAHIKNIIKNKCNFIDESY